MDIISDLPNEEWRNIEEYNGYQVSNYGRIKSFKRNNAHLLGIYYNNKGYGRVALSRNGQSKRILVSRLVAEAFCEKPHTEEFLTVDHIDTNKKNNNASNLRWMTQEENLKIYYAEQRKGIIGK